jgi:hypothetical protein
MPAGASGRLITASQPSDVDSASVGPAATVASTWDQAVRPPRATMASRTSTRCGGLTRTGAVSTVVRGWVVDIVTPTFRWPVPLQATRRPRPSKAEERQQRCRTSTAAATVHLDDKPFDLDDDFTSLRAAPDNSLDRTPGFLTPPRRFTALRKFDDRPGRDGRIGLSASRRTIRV